MACIKLYVAANAAGILIYQNISAASVFVYVGSLINKVRERVDTVF